MLFNDQLALLIKLFLVITIRILLSLSFNSKKLHYSQGQGIHRVNEILIPFLIDNRLRNEKSGISCHQKNT
jgi:hypothetical protein